MVSCWLSPVSPGAETLTVGVPEVVSLYVNVAMLEPAGIVIGDAGVKVAPADVELRFTVWPPVGALATNPKASCSCTVIGFEVAPAASVCGAVAITSFWGQRSCAVSLVGENVGLSPA